MKHGIVGLLIVAVSVKAHRALVVLDEPAVSIAEYVEKHPVRIVSVHELKIGIGLETQDLCFRPYFFDFLGPVHHTGANVVPEPSGRALSNPFHLSISLF